MPTPTAAVSPRRDARRNHVQLVAAARELFAIAGVDASVEEISKRAGVGIGTLYRHFATKEELIDAVLEDAFHEYAELADAALAHADAWVGFCGFLEAALELHAGNRGLKDVAASGAHGLERVAAIRRRLQPLLGRLVVRAQEGGGLRADFTAQDVSLLLWGGHGVIEHGAGSAPEIWRRYLDFVLAGVRGDRSGPRRGTDAS
jgi:AcrR family transcriptional regulator